MKLTPCSLCLRRIGGARCHVSHSEEEEVKAGTSIGAPPRPTATCVTGAVSITVRRLPHTAQDIHHRERQSD